MFIIGGIEDQITLYVWGYLSNRLFSITNPKLANFYVYQDTFKSMTHPLKTSQPIMWTLYSVLSTVFGAGFLNIFVVFTLIIVLAFSYIYFKRYGYPLIFALLFSLSTYNMTHFGRHVALTQIWLIPLFFLVLETDSKGFKKELKLAVVLTITTLISNYLGFFLFLSYGVYKLVIIYQARFKIKKILHILKRLAFTFAISSILLSPALLPYYKAVYLNKGAESMQLTNAKKSVSDFATFSSRPWYFFIPPTKNPFLGNFSKRILAGIESTGYFLADDYFTNEHQSNYFGLFLLGTLFYLSFVLKENMDKRKKKEVFTYLVVASVLISFMMPPYFTIAGLKVYTPNWLVFRYFPVFRVMARLGIVVNFLILAVYAKLLAYIRAESLIVKGVLNIFMILVLFITLVETFIPPKIQRIEKPPEVFEHLGNKSEVVRFAVYPYSKTDEAYFWLPVHKQLMVNPRDYISLEFDYETEELTNSIPSLDGISKLRELKVDYIVVYKEGWDEKFIQLAEDLELEGEYSESYLFRLR